MLKRSFKPAKCKTALKLATARMKIMKNKRENNLKQMKRELAQLLDTRQDQTARIRVEHVVQEEKMIAVYGIIDLYCELLIARLPIIESQKQCPIDLKVAVAGIVFAAQRCADIPELQDVRKHFTAKYGKEFVNAALELRPDCGVSSNLVENLSANAPDGQTKLKIFAAIADEHNIQWDPKTFGEKESKPYDDLLKGPNAYHQAPPPNNVNPPEIHDQKHDSAVNCQQNWHSSSSQNFAPSDFSGRQSAPSSTHHSPMRSSETEYQRIEPGHSHPRNEKSFSSNQQNWNMEFKDATAAAQAAAESAEHACMAARAAGELSARDRISRQNSNKSHQTTDDDVGGRFYKDEYSSAKTFSQLASPRSRTASTYDESSPSSDSDDESKRSSSRVSSHKVTLQLSPQSSRLSTDRKGSSGDSSAKVAARDSPTYTQNSYSSSREENSFSCSRMGPKIEKNSSSRKQLRTYDLDTGREEDYPKSKFSPPSGYYDPSDESDSEEDLPKRPSTIEVSRLSGSAESMNTASVSRNEPKPKLQSDKHSVMEQPSSSFKTPTSSASESSRTSRGEAPSGENSLKKTSHVHPKLPDYDSLAAHFQALKQNRD